MTVPDRPRPIAIRKWHVGKLVLLWVWGAAVCFVLIQIILRTTNFVPGFILIGLLLAILISLSVLTWIWLGGKEQ